MTTNEKALQLHEEWNGKIETTSKCQVKTREDLAIAYTPGVAEPCKDMHATIKKSVYQSLQKQISSKLLMVNSLTYVKKLQRIRNLHTSIRSNQTQLLLYQMVVLY